MAINTGGSSKGPITTLFDQCNDITTSPSHISISNVTQPFEQVTTLDGSAGALKCNSDLYVDGINVGEFMKTVGERLLILEADFKKHEQYPALKDAYDQYKMLEKLLTGNNGSGQGTD